MASLLWNIITINKSSDHLLSSSLHQAYPSSLSSPWSRETRRARARVVWRWLSGKYKQQCFTEPSLNSNQDLNTPHTPASPDTMADIRPYWELQYWDHNWYFLSGCSRAELGRSSALPGSPLLVSGVSHFEFQLSESPRDIIASVIIIITRYDTRPLPMSQTNDPLALPALFYWEVMTGQPQLPCQPPRWGVGGVGGVHRPCPPLLLSGVAVDWWRARRAV